MTLKELKQGLINKKGVSLIELIVALSLTILVLGVVGIFFISNYLSFNDARDLEILLADGGIVSKALDDELRACKGIVEAKKVGDAYQTFTLLRSDGVTRVTFSFSGNTISQQVGTGSVTVLTHRALSFRVLPVQEEVVAIPDYVSDGQNGFTQGETRGIEYAFTLQEGKMTRETLSQVSFRNKD